MNKFNKIRHEFSFAGLYLLFPGSNLLSFSHPALQQYGLFCVLADEVVKVLTENS